MSSRMCSSSSSSSRSRTQEPQGLGQTCEVDGAERVGEREGQRVGVLRVEALLDRLRNQRDDATLSNAACMSSLWSEGIFGCDRNRSC